MNIAVLNTQIPFCTGGAEVLADDLIAALKARGHNACLVTVPFKWYPQQSLIDNIIACKLLDISDYNGVEIDKVIALKFPLWLIEHQNKSLWILHQHRTAYELWDTPYNDLAAMPDGDKIRKLIVREDNRALSACESIYTISQTVSDRLLKFNHLPSEALYPPPRAMDEFYCSGYGEYFFFPSRITPLKRQSLVIEALAHASRSIKVIFAGQADNDSYLKSLQSRAAELGVSQQIQWLGHITEQEKIRHYAECLMVIFTSCNEDYGYITPEAMLSSKGVITLDDSGGALEFVDHDQTGSISPADPRVLGEELDRVWNNRILARTYGENARTRITGMGISWDKVIGSLV
ncbi:MAG: glycosyltransferase family 4 protein [Halioglobus sp.]